MVGNKIEDTFEQLRLEWFGDQKGLHIDSYIKIRFIDGFIVKPILSKKNKSLKKHKKESLWFINIGGYSPIDLKEQHQFGLIVAKTANEAKLRAKKNWLNDVKLKHKDDSVNLNTIDNFYLIQNINNWEIELTPDIKNRSQPLIPDWYGYLRIDKL